MSESSSSIYEIREFIDNDGSYLRSEVSDLASNISNTVQKVQTQNLPTSNTEESPANGVDIEEKLYEHLKHIGIAKTEQTPLDENAAFVRELALLSTSNSNSLDNEYIDNHMITENHSNTSLMCTSSKDNEISSKNTSDMSDIFDKLLVQEQQAILLKQKEQIQNQKINGAGWQKGFFAKQKDTKKNVTEKKEKGTEPQSKIKALDRYTDKYSNASRIPSKPVTEQNRQEIVNSDATSVMSEKGLQAPSVPVSSSIDKVITTTTTKRPAAFTGLVVERFPE